MALLIFEKKKSCFISLIANMMALVSNLLNITS